MATKALTLSDLFASLPATSFGMANTTPATLPQTKPKSLTGKPTSSLSQLSINQPPAPGITLPPGSPLAGIGSKLSIAPNGTVAPPVVPKPVAPSTSPIFTPSSAGPSSAPVGPAGATGAAGGVAMKNPDGSYKTADQIAAEIGGTLKNVHTNPDLGTITAQQFTSDPATAADAETRARQIDNTRNDIASGAKDPYGVGADSGIAYTPAELTAIEHAYAGVYDPALDSALAKVNQKQQEDAQKNAPYTLGKDDVRYDGQGNIIAVGIPSTATGAAGGTYVAGQDPTADAYVKGIQAGTLKFSDVPTTYQNLVAQGIGAATGPNAPISPTSTTAIGIINQLQGLDLGALSGTGVIGAVEHPSSLFPGTDVQKTQNLAKQLQATIALSNRQQLKGSGAISDFEFRVLGDAATALGLNDAGRTNLSPADFKDQLQKLEVRLQVGQTKSLTDDEVQALSQQGFSAQAIRDYDASQAGGGVSFNGVGNTTASTGNIPQRNNNPGDVKAGGIADSLATGKDQYGHLIFATPADGFKALAADLTAKINGGSSHLPANPTIAQLGTVYAEDPTWGAKVAAILGVPASTPTKQIPIDQLAQAIAHQEGFYA